MVTDFTHNLIFHLLKIPAVDGKCIHQIISSPDSSEKHPADQKGQPESPQIPLVTSNPLFKRFILPLPPFLYVRFLDKIQRGT